jgi:cytochrome P450
MSQDDPMARADREQPAEGRFVISYPIRRTGPFEPPPEYARLRASDPVARVRLWNGDEAWLVTRYQDVKAVLADTRFSADATRAGFPRFRTGFPRLAAGGAKNITKTSGLMFMRLDPPKHDVLRQMVTSEFTTHRMRAFRPWIQRQVDGLVDELLARGPSADLVAGLALPLPSLVICEMLGVPARDRAFFEEQGALLMSAKASQRQSLVALKALAEYFERLVTEQESAPGPGIAGRLITERLHTGQLEREDLIATLRLLVIAGHETTASMIGLILAGLLARPAGMELLRAGPELIPAAIEEMLRYHTMTMIGLPRVVTEDVTLGGTLIRAGEGVIASVVSANRDATVFPDPDRCEFTRRDRQHVAFGFGVHQCLGQMLARIEMDVVIETVLRRMPRLALAVPFEQLRFRDDLLVFRVDELPVSW